MSTAHVLKGKFSCVESSVRLACARARLRPVERPYAALISSTVRTPGGPGAAGVRAPRKSSARAASAAPSVAPAAAPAAPRGRSSRCASDSPLARAPADAEPRRSWPCTLHIQSSTRPSRTRSSMHKAAKRAWSSLRPAAAYKVNVQGRTAQKLWLLRRYLRVERGQVVGGRHVVCAGAGLAAALAAGAARLVATARTNKQRVAGKHSPSSS